MSIKFSIDCVFAIAKDGCLYSWGRNLKLLGRSVIGNRAVPENYPGLVDLPKDVKCVAIELGEDCVFAIDQAGQGYSWGTAYPLLARSIVQSEAARYPGLVSLLDGIQCSAIKIIYNCVFVVDRRGRIYSWGYYGADFSPLGRSLASMEDAHHPRLLLLPDTCPTCQSSNMQILSSQTHYLCHDCKQQFHTLSVSKDSGCVIS